MVLQIEGNIVHRLHEHDDRLPQGVSNAYFVEDIGIAVGQVSNDDPGSAELLPDVLHDWADAIDVVGFAAIE